MDEYLLQQILEQLQKISAQLAAIQAKIGCAHGWRVPALLENLEVVTMHLKPYSNLTKSYENNDFRRVFY